MNRLIVVINKLVSNKKLPGRVKRVGFALIESALILSNQFELSGWSTRYNLRVQLVDCVECRGPVHFQQESFVAFVLAADFFSPQSWVFVLTAWMFSASNCGCVRTRGTFLIKLTCLIVKPIKKWSYRSDSRICLLWLYRGPRRCMKGDDVFVNKSKLFLVQSSRTNSTSFMARRTREWLIISR